MSRKRNYYAVPGLIVYDSGDTIEREYKQKNPSYPNYPRKLAIRMEQNGRKYVVTNDKGKLYVDVLVATCFCHKPVGANAVFYKDGNYGNTCYSNLSWGVEDLPDGTRAIGNGYSVSKDGKVLKDGKEVVVLDYLYDPDQDRHVAINPHFRDSNSKIRDVDEVIARAYLPIPAGIKTPKILHKDLDYANSKLSNLQWIEESSPEYQEYKKAKEKAKKLRNKELEIEFHGH